jgi:hypothetical protein
LSCLSVGKLEPSQPACPLSLCLLANAQPTTAPAARARSARLAGLPVSRLLDVGENLYFDVPQGVLPEATKQYYEDPLLKVRLRVSSQVVPAARCCCVPGPAAERDRCRRAAQRSMHCPGSCRAPDGAGWRGCQKRRWPVPPACPRCAAPRFTRQGFPPPQGEGVREPNFGCKGVQLEWEWSGRRSLMARRCMRDLAERVQVRPPSF